MCCLRCARAARTACNEATRAARIVPRGVLSDRNVPSVDNGIYTYVYICVCVCVCVSSNLHPSSNSWWLHHTALRYMRRVQLGAYTWRKGLNSVQTGSKWAQNTWLSMPNGVRSIFEKRFFDPFLTHFWSQNNPFSRHFPFFPGPKHVTTGSKRAKNTCLRIPNGQG